MLLLLVYIFDLNNEKDNKATTNCFIKNEQQQQKMGSFNLFFIVTKGQIYAV